MNDTTRTTTAAPPSDETTVPEAVDPRIERTLAAVLEASFQLLMVDGPDSVTHGHVAAAANVSRTTVYKHFPTRTDLLRATIEQLGDARPQDLTGDLRSDLRTLLADAAADLADDQRSRVLATMLERSLHDDAVAAVRDGFVCEGVEMFQRIVDRAVDDGELRPGIDVDLALAGLFGTLFFRRFMLGTPITDDQVDHILDVFIDNHRPR